MLLLLTICIFLSLLCPLPAWASPEEASSLRLVQGEWAHEVRGMDDYDPNPEGRFKRGERGYAYIVVEGFDVGQDGEYYFLHLSVDAVSYTHLDVYKRQEDIEKSKAGKNACRVQAGYGNGPENIGQEGAQIADRSGKLPQKADLVIFFQSFLQLLQIGDRGTVECVIIPVFSPSPFSRRRAM